LVIVKRCGENLRERTAPSQRAVIKIKSWCGVDAKLDILTILSHKKLKTAFILIAFILSSFFYYSLCNISPAFAKVENSKHDFVTMGCAGCHAPYSAPEDLYWRWGLSQETGYYLQTDNPDYLRGYTLYCYDCHDGQAADNEPGLPFVDPPQDIAFDDGPGGRVGYYETKPPGSPPPTNGDPTGGHYIASNPPDLQSISQGDKLSCSDCHNPHNVQTPGLGGLEPLRTDPDFNEVFINPVLGGKAVVGLKASHNTRNWNGVATGRGMCTTCHSYSDAGTPVTFKDVNPAYNSTAQIIRPPAGVAGHSSLDYTPCTDCHTHNSVAHGGGGGAGCVSCHGHDPGYEYEPGKFSQGIGTFNSHSTHTENDSDDLKGPNVACGECHDTNNFPYFKSGVDSNGDGKYSLQETDACDACHSPSGDYDGVSDPDIGAKNNWDAGVYDGNSLRSGNEKWCAGCHDKSPSVIQSVSAPNVIGDEGASTPYGTGYGYYKTGHGLSTSEVYPWTKKPGDTQERMGAGILCSSCHDFSIAHTDGLARTYYSTAGDPGTSARYRAGYRLKLVDGGYPLAVPRKYVFGDPVEVKADEFKLCFQAGCHPSTPFTDSSSSLTNFRDDKDVPQHNDHYYHLAIQDTYGPGPVWQSDWALPVVGNGDSRAQCAQCHNVHGSTRLSMMNDGKLVSREPGIRELYDNLPYPPPSPPPVPSNLTLPDSTSTAWIPDDFGPSKSSSVCTQACHGGPSGVYSFYFRTPFDVNAPTITNAYGTIGSPFVTVRFSEAVYTTPGSGNLTAGDFALTDLDDGRIITGVAHTAGDKIAILTLSSPLDISGDIGVDTVSAADATSIYDVAGNPMSVVLVIILDNDSSPPAASNLNPQNGAVSVDSDSNLTFTLSDGGSGVDSTTFNIELSGNKGYHEFYANGDPEISKTGNPAGYNYTINPSVNFGSEETITVTVNVNDLSGNSLVPPAWSFTSKVAGLPTTIVVHPSGLFSAGSWSPVGTGSWPVILDSNDGDGGYALHGTGSGTDSFLVDMDDPAGLTGAVQSVKIYALVRVTDGSGSGIYVSPVNVSTVYRTGTNSLLKQTTIPGGTSGYTLIQSDTYTTDSDGWALDWADIDNLKAGVRRGSTGAHQERVTEVYAEVTYTPTTPVTVIGAIASDPTSPYEAGIQAGDTVTIKFNGATAGTPINSGNINTALALSGGHSWLDGSGNIGSAIWSSNTYTNDRLTIALSTNTSPPSVAVGDTITLGGIIKDSYGASIVDSEVIGGSFGEVVTDPPPENLNGSVWDDLSTPESESYNYNHPQQYVSEDVNSDYCTRCHDWTSLEERDKYAFPHGRYTTSSNKCRECHAVHRARGRYMLTRADDEYTACDYCHGSGSGAGKKVEMADEGISNGHHLGYTGIAPDTDYDTPYSVTGFTCHDCHSVHANKKRMIAGIIDVDFLNAPEGIAPPHIGLLLGRPNHSNTADHNFCGEFVDLTDWCSTCHEGNGGIANGGGSEPKDHKDPMVVYDNITESFEEAYSHDCQTEGMTRGGDKYLTCDTTTTDANYPKVDPTDSENQGPTCRQCHASNWISEFPHKSDGYVLLKTGASDTSLDNVCLDCHKADSLP